MDERGPQIDVFLVHTILSSILPVLAVYLQFFSAENAFLYSPVLTPGRMCGLLSISIGCVAPAVYPVVQLLELS